jgi:hypothetical protein
MKQTSEEIDKNVMNLIMNENDVIYNKFKNLVEKIKENFDKILKEKDLNELNSKNSENFENSVLILVMETTKVIKDMRELIDNFKNKLKEIENTYEPLSYYNSHSINLIRNNIIPNFEVCYKSQTDFIGKVYRQMFKV